MRNLANLLMMFTIIVDPRWENTGGIFYVQIAPTRQERLENPVPKCKNGACCLITMPGSAAEQTSFPPCVNLPFSACACFFCSDQELSGQELSVAVCLYNTSDNENSFLVQAVKHSYNPSIIY